MLRRSDRSSLSGHKLQHRSLRCLISDKDRAAFDLHCRFRRQRRTRCGFSRDCEDEAGARAPSNAEFSRLLPTISCGNSRTKPRSRFSPGAKPPAVPAARPKKKRLSSRSCARSICPSLFGDRIIANVQRYRARLASNRACPRRLRPRTRPRLRGRDRGAAIPVPTQVRCLVQCLDGRGTAHPSEPLEKLALESSYLDAVLLASSWSKSFEKTCFAFPTCGTALAWSTLPGFPTTIIATIPMP
jgi:hypothetical protein